MITTLPNTIIGTFRRWYFMLFKKDYIKESLSRRKGQCKQCTCCEVMLIPCPHYDYSTKECKIWRDKGFDALPKVCQIYPFDEKDKNCKSKKYCGYHWDDPQIDSPQKSTSGEKLIEVSPPIEETATQTKEMPNVVAIDKPRTIHSGDTLRGKEDIECS